MSENSKMEAGFSTLVLSLGSSGAMALGLTPHPETGKTQVNKAAARLNIDLLKVLQEKTQNNLSNEEHSLLQNILSDLQLRFVELK